MLNLAQAGLTSYELAFNFLNYMKTKERHYAPWAAVTAHLLKLKFPLYETIVYQDFQVLQINNTVQPSFFHHSLNSTTSMQITQFAYFIIHIFS